MIKQSLIHSISKLNFVMPFDINKLPNNQSVGARNIVLGLNVRNTIDLLLEPTFNYMNILQRQLGLFKFVFGQDRYEMLHMSTPRFMLKPKKGCHSWNPNVRYNLRPHEILAFDYELEGEQCRDEFDQLVYRNLRPGVGESASDALNAVENAMILALREGLYGDVFRIAFFGNQNFSTEVAAGDFDLSALSTEEQDNLTAMLQHQNGYFSELRARSLLTDPNERVVYVDSNDGTLSGNATLSTNIEDYLQEMINQADPVLQNWNLSMPQQNWPVFVLQRGLYNAYKKLLESRDVLSSYQLMIDGEAVPGVLTYEGYPVVMMPEWDAFDYETGKRSTTTGLSLKQRALFIAPENLCGVVNARSTDNMLDIGLQIQESPVLSDKRKKFMWANYAFGFGIAQPKLVVAGWNSSETYTTS